MGKLVKKWISLLLTALMLAGIPLSVNAEAPPEEVIAASEETGNALENTEDAPVQPEEESGAADPDETGTPTDLVEPEAEEFPVIDIAAGDETYYDTDIFGSVQLSTKSVQPTRKDKKPYGDRFAMTISELFQTGYVQSGSYVGPYAAWLVGHEEQHNNDLATQFTNFEGDGTPQREGSNTSYREKETAMSYEADFDGDGRRSQVVTLSDVNITGVDVSVGEAADVIDDNYHTTSIRYDGIERLPEEYRFHLGNRHDLNLAIGDLDGDDYDEVIYLLPNIEVTNEPKAKLRVMSLRNPSPDVNWRLRSSWTFTDYTLNIGFGGADGVVIGSDEQSHRRIHSLAVGDLDGDGKDDIAVMSSGLVLSYKDSQKNISFAELNIFRGSDFTSNTVPDPAETYYYHSDGDNSNRPQNAQPLFGTGGLIQLPSESAIKMDKDSINAYLSSPGTEGTCAYSKLHPMQFGLDIVDAGGKGSKKELLLGYDYLVSGNIMMPSGMVATSGFYSGYQVEPLHYGDNGVFQRVGKDLPPIQMTALDVSQRNGLYTSESNRVSNYYGGVYGTPTEVLKAPEFKDAAFAYRPIQLTAARMSEGQATPSIIVNNNQHVLEQGGYTLKKMSEYTGQTNANTLESYPISVCDVYDLRPATMSSGEGDDAKLHFGYVAQFVSNTTTGSNEVRTHFVSGDKDTFVWYHPTTNTDTFGSTFSTQRQGATFCLPDTDLDSPVLTFQGYDFLYTDPTVLAAIAAPPYVKDIAELDSSYLSDFSTSFSLSIGAGGGTVKGRATNLGAYLSTTLEIGVVAKGIVEFEAEYNHNWNEENEVTIEKSESVEFETSEQDVVVVLTYPMDVFTYTMEYPANEAGTDTSTAEYVFHQPYEPVYKIISLEDYDKAYQRFPDDLPDIAGEIFKHEPGYPDTYTYNPADYNAWVASVAAEFGTAGNTTTSYTVSESNTATTTTTNSVDFKLGGGAKFGGAVVEAQVTVGATFGKEWTNGGITTNTNETTFSGKIGQNSLHNQLPYAGTSCKLIQYNYRGVQNFPVVTYQVNMNRNNSGYPYQPTEYGIDDTLSTDTQLSVYWEPSRDDEWPGANSNLTYVVYRKLKSEGGDPTAIMTATPRYDPLDGRYTLVDTGLTKGETYEYFITCHYKGDDTIATHIKTPTFIGITNQDATKNYGFTKQPPEQLTINPDIPASVTVEFAEGALPAASVEYSWQKYSSSAWSDLGTSYKTNTLTFNSPVPGYIGRYRVMAKYAGKSFYSDEMQVVYEPHRTEVSLSVTPETMADDTGTITATATVTSAFGDVDDNTSMRFIFTKPDGSTVLKSVIVKGGVATASLNTEKPGLYDVTASFPGNTKFASSRSETVYRNKRGTDRWTYSLPMTQKQFYYGDTFTVSMSAYNPSTGKPQPGAPTIKVYKCENNETVGPPLTGWVQGVDAVDDADLEFTRNVELKGTGKYRLEIRALRVEHADNGPVYYDIIVKPRPVNYTIRDLTLYKDSDINWSNLPDLWEIDCTSGSMQFGEPGYSKDNLELYDASNRLITEYENLDFGTYYIKVANPIESTNYDISVKTGVFTYSDLSGTDLVTVELAEDEMGSIKALLPALAQGGGKMAKDESLTLEAVPKKSYYLFKGWEISDDNPDNLTKKGVRVTIKKVDKDLTVKALFEVPEIAISPSSVELERGGQQSFQATLPADLSGEVTWSVEDNRAPGTKIEDDGILVVSDTEGSKSLTVTAVSKVDGDVKGSVKVTVNQPSLTIAVQDEDGKECTDFTLAVNEEHTFTVQAVPSDHVAVKLKAVSAKKTVADVSDIKDPATETDGTFTVKGKAAGITTLTVELELGSGDGTVSVPFTVRVLDKKGETVTAELPDKASLKVGGTLKLTPVYTPAKAPLANVAWSSENADIADVDNTGKVTAKGPGETTITLKFQPWGSKDTFEKNCVVTVTAPAKSVKITGEQGGSLPKNITLALKEVNAKPLYQTEIKLQAAPTPANTDDSITWSSDNSGVAEVDASGKVKAIGIGSTTITVMAGTRKATCKVTVFMPVPDGGVGLNKTDLSLNVGGSESLLATVTGDPAPTNQKVVWSSDDTSVAAVSNRGKVTAKHLGAATIRATSAENPAVYKDCLVTVTAPVTAMTFRQKTFTLEAGKSTALGLTFNGGKGITGPVDVTLTSSNEKVLAFTGDDAKDGGKTLTLTTPTDLVNLTVPAAAEGTDISETVTITAEAPRPGSNRPFKATLKVKVTNKGVVVANSVKLTAASEKKAPGTGGYVESSPNMPLAVGASFTPAVSFDSTKVSDKNITWTLTAKQAGMTTDPLKYVDFDPGSGKVTARYGCESMTVLTLKGVSHDVGAEGVNIQFQTVKRVRKLSLKTAAGASTTMDPGDQIQLLAVVDPAEAGYDKLKWTSLDENIAKIESGDEGQNVTVKAENPGRVTLRVEAQDGSKKFATIKLTVRQALKDIVITNEQAGEYGSPGTKVLPQGKTLKLSAGLNLANQVDNSSGSEVLVNTPAPTSKAVTWRLVYGEGVVSLNTKTGVVKGLTNGTALIEVLPADAREGTYDTSATVHKLDGETETYCNTIQVSVNVAAKSVKVDQKPFSVNGTNRRLTMSATLNPAIEKLSQEERKLVWSIPKDSGLEFDMEQPAMASGGTQSESEDKNYWTFKTNGYMTEVMLKATSGTTTAKPKVTVTTASKKSASITVVMQADALKAPPVDRVDLKQSAVWVPVGKSTRLSAVITPSDAGNKNLSWSIEEYPSGFSKPSGNSGPVMVPPGSVAVVDATGKVTVKGTGYAVVTVTSMDGKRKASCTIYCVARN